MRIQDGFDNFATPICFVGVDDSSASCQPAAGNSGAQKGSGGPRRTLRVRSTFLARAGLSKRTTIVSAKPSIPEVQAEIAVWLADIGVGGGE